MNEGVSEWHVRIVLSMIAQQGIGSTMAKNAFMSEKAHLLLNTPKGFRGRSFLLAVAIDFEGDNEVQ